MISLCLLSVYLKDCVAIQSPETVLLKAPESSLSARLSDKSVPVTAQRFQFSQASRPISTIVSIDWLREPVVFLFNHSEESSNLSLEILFEVKCCALSWVMHINWFCLTDYSQCYINIVVFLGLWSRHYTEGDVWCHSEGSCEGCARRTKLSGFYIWYH